MDWGREIGTVSEIPVKDLPATKIDDFSLHQIPTSNMLRELEEQSGVDVGVIVCDIGDVPEMIEPGLSPEIEAAVKLAGERIAGKFNLAPI